MATSSLPFVDTHTVSVALGPAPLWTALRKHADNLGRPGWRVLGFVLGTDPPAGFAVVREIPGERLVLAGRHRFAQYELMLTIERRTSERTTMLHATTHAAFPGVRGRVYRRLVVGSGLHAVVTRRLLRTIVASAGAGTD